MALVEYGSNSGRMMGTCPTKKPSQKSRAKTTHPISFPPFQGAPPPKERKPDQTCGCPFEHCKLMLFPTKRATLGGPKRKVEVCHSASFPHSASSAHLQPSSSVLRRGHPVGSRTIARGSLLIFGQHQVSSRFGQKSGFLLLSGQTQTGTDLARIQNMCAAYT